MKIVINTCFGGFGLSIEAKAWLKERGLESKNWTEERNNPLVVECVETLKEKADGSFSELKIVEIPDDVKWHIAEYDGHEHVAENHKTWS